MFFISKKRKLEYYDIEILINPIFDDIKLHKVAPGELGRQTLLVYYYGLLTHLSKKLKVSDKLCHAEFIESLQESFSYDSDEAIEWQVSLKDVLENNRYNVATTFYEHGYDAFMWMEQKAYSKVVEF